VTAHGVNLSGARWDQPGQKLSALSASPRRIFTPDGLDSTRIKGIRGAVVAGAGRAILKKEIGAFMTVNKAILVGNLGQDPEVRATGGGTPVATLRVATSDRRKDREGNWTDHTEWHTVVVFGRQAENVGKYCRKGKQLYIEGRIQTRKWQDKDGRDRYNTEVVADTVRFLGGRNEGGGGGSYGGGGGGGNQGGGNQGGGSQGGGNQGGGDQGGGDDMPYRDTEIPF